MTDPRIGELDWLLRGLLRRQVRWPVWWQVSLLVDRQARQELSR